MQDLRSRVRLLDDKSARLGLARAGRVRTTTAPALRVPEEPAAGQVARATPDGDRSHRKAQTQQVQSVPEELDPGKQGRRKSIRNPVFRNQKEVFLAAVAAWNDRLGETAFSEISAECSNHWCNTTCYLRLLPCRAVFPLLSLR